MRKICKLKALFISMGELDHIYANENSFHLERNAQGMCFLNKE